MCAERHPQVNAEKAEKLESARIGATLKKAAE
jgi:hypothetical protein